MHIDWFIVLMLAIAVLFGWWASWLTVKRTNPKGGGGDAGDEAKDYANH